MQPPEHEHVLLVSKWSQEIIMGLIFILLTMSRFIGKRMGGKQVEYATVDQLAICSIDVSSKIDKLEENTSGNIKHLTKRIDALIESFPKR